MIIASEIESEPIILGQILHGAVLRRGCIQQKATRRCVEL
jgi:hypothetical protein